MGNTNALTLVSATFALCGVAMLGVAAWAGNRQYTIIRTWPEVEATVTRSQVLHGSDAEDDTTMYRAEVEFRYVANGREYVTPSQTDYSSSSYPEMKNRVDAFPPGTRHRIKYNPGDPGDIRFTAGYNFGFFFLPTIFGGLGLLFTGIGLPLWWAGQPRNMVLCDGCGAALRRGDRFCPNCSAPRPIG